MVREQMFRVLFFIFSLNLFVTVSGGGDGARSAGSTNDFLVIDRSFTRVSTAKATLIIQPLVRKGEVFAGDYEMKVTPYFFKSEGGKLEIHVPHESLAKAEKGIPVEITGTALTNGEKVKRKINALATPRDKSSGELKVWFLADERQMVFNTNYRLQGR
jgi:hypothetical protein